MINKKRIKTLEDFEMTFKQTEEIMSNFKLKLEREYITDDIEFISDRELLQLFCEIMLSTVKNMQ